MTQELTIRELVAMAQGMVLMDEEVRLGFVASSQESARCTGYAVAQMLAPHGATWHPAFQQVRWPSGATLAFLSVQNPDRLRGHRWAAAFLSTLAASRASLEALQGLNHTTRSPGAGVLRCAEVANRLDLEEQLRQTA